MAQPTAITSVRQAFAHVYIIDLAGELTSSVEVQARASDPLYELVFRFVGSKLQDQIWTHVLAARLGASGEVQMHKMLLDPKVQWGRAGNIWYNAQLRTLLYSPIALLRWISTWFRPGSRGKSKREDR